MVKTPAERQAEFRQRKQQRLDECVTPDDVRRAIRLIYEYCRSQPGDRSPPWDEWLAHCQSRRGANSWFQMVPESDDPADYDDFALIDAVLLAKVGAVFKAMKVPVQAD
ncbi:MAG TPA: hypothetical protein VJM34_01445 [Novosphingobium sp.]|nr:hypothetical protein [Novosphingobium sp.]